MKSLFILSVLFLATRFAHASIETDGWTADEFSQFARGASHSVVRSGSITCVDRLVQDQAGPKSWLSRLFVSWRPTPSLLPEGISQPDSSWRVSYAEGDDEIEIRIQSARGLTAITAVFDSATRRLSGFKMLGTSIEFSNPELIELTKSEFVRNTLGVFVTPDGHELIALGGPDQTRRVIFADLTSRRIFEAASNEG